MEFIRNPYDIFLQINYDDSQSDDDSPLHFPEDKLKGRYVRVVVEKKTKPYLFEKFIDRLYTAQTHGVTVIEDFYPEEEKGSIEIDLGEDTLTLINKEIDTLGNVENKERLKSLIRDLHSECLEHD